MDDIDLLKARYDSLEEGMLVVDAAGVILSANPAACTMFGYAAEELDGQPVSGLLEPAGQTHRQAGGLVNAVQKNGTGFTARISVSETLYQDSRIYAWVILDLSGEKRADENGANQLKTRFISLASHEFRTPLSSIQLSAALIERYYDRLERPKVFQHLHKIKRAVGALTAMLEELLSVERLDSGKTEPVCSEFDLRSLCKEVVAEMQEQSGQTIFCTHKGLMSCVSLDKNLLRQCLANLLSNAIKYSGGRGIIELRSAVWADGCRISVSDNGIGIPAAEQGHLFGPFFRATNTVNIPGTGLGLHIVKRYVDLLQGGIRFESSEQAGTTFILSFPAERER